MSVKKMSVMKMSVMKNPLFQVMKMSVKKILVKKMLVKKKEVKKNPPVVESKLSATRDSAESNLCFFILDNSERTWVLGKLY